MPLADRRRLRARMCDEGPKALLPSAVAKDSLTFSMWQLKVKEDALSNSRAQAQDGANPLQPGDARVTRGASEAKCFSTEGAAEMLPLPADGRGTERMLCRGFSFNDSKAKARFLDQMSHELRTPLNGILGIVQLLQASAPLAPEQASYLEIIRCSTESLISVLSSILDKCQVEAAALPRAHHLQQPQEEALPQEPTFSLRECVAKASQLMLASAADREVQLQSSVKEDVPESVEGDSLQFFQVLCNLMSGGIESTHRGSVCLDVSCVALSDAPRHTRGVTSEDEGRPASPSPHCPTCTCGSSARRKSSQDLSSKVLQRKQTPPQAMSRLYHVQGAPVPSDSAGTPADADASGGPLHGSRQGGVGRGCAGQGPYVLEGCHLSPPDKSPLQQPRKLARTTSPGWHSGVRPRACPRASSNAESVRPLADNGSLSGEGTVQVQLQPRERVVQLQLRVTAEPEVSAEDLISEAFDSSSNSSSDCNTSLCCSRGRLSMVAARSLVTAMGGTIHVALSEHFGGFATVMVPVRAACTQGNPTGPALAEAGKARSTPAVHHGAPVAGISWKQKPTGPLTQLSKRFNPLSGGRPEVRREHVELPHAGAKRTLSGTVSELQGLSESHQELPVPPKNWKSLSLVSAGWGSPNGSFSQGQQQGALEDSCGEAGGLPGGRLHKRKAHNPAPGRGAAACLAQGKVGPADSNLGQEGSRFDSAGPSVLEEAKPMVPARGLRTPECVLGLPRAGQARSGLADLASSQQPCFGAVRGTTAGATAPLGCTSSRISVSSSCTGKTMMARGGPVVSQLHPLDWRRPGAQSTIHASRAFHSAQSTTGVTLHSRHQRGATEEHHTAQQTSLHSVNGTQAVEAHHRPSRVQQRPVPAAVLDAVDPERAAELKGLSVLVVDDNMVNQIVLQRMLKILDISCDMASNGAEAVTACEHKHYDVVFMDCNMPVMDGYEASRTIRASNVARKPETGNTGDCGLGLEPCCSTVQWNSAMEQRLPSPASGLGGLKKTEQCFFWGKCLCCPKIIAVTANALQGDERKCRAAGMNGFIPKPVRLADIVSMLLKCVDEEPLPTEMSLV